MRAGTTGAVAAVIAAAAHATGGGAFPPPIMLATCAALALLLCLAAAGRRSTPLRSLVAVGGTQALFHVVFSLTGPASAHALPGHHHGVAITAMAGGAAATPDAAMPAAHALAAVLTALAVHRGETALRGLAASLALAFGRVWAPRPVVTPVDGPARPALAVLGAGSSPSFALVLLGALRHRGPPAAPAH